MEKFPEDFNFEQSEQILQESILNSKELSNARKHVYEQYKLALEHNNEYFMIDLSECQPNIRDILLKELLEKFPHIGYQAEHKLRMDKLFNTLLNSGKSADPEFDLLNNTFTRHVRRFQPNQIDTSYVANYVIALTKKFAENMETYEWPGPSRG